MTISAQDLVTWGNRAREKEIQRSRRGKRVTRKRTIENNKRASAFVFVQYTEMCKICLYSITCDCLNCHAAAAAAVAVAR